MSRGKDGAGASNQWVAALPVSGSRFAGASPAGNQSQQKRCRSSHDQGRRNLHGANAGGWCFDNFAKVFAAKGFTCHAPDLIGHGKNKALASVGIPDYRAEMEAFLKTFDTPPVMLGHSMGAVIAQQLAAQGMARALILISPGPRAGILPTTGGEKQLDQDLMGLGAFWKMVIPPDFALSCIYSLNKVPTSEQRAVFDKFGPESGLAFFQLFFWMLDATGATVVATEKVNCPVLCLSGADDKVVSLMTARATAAAYPSAPFWELQGHGHMLLVEPGADEIAQRIAGWIPA